MNHDISPVALVTLFGLAASSLTAQGQSVPERSGFLFFRDKSEQISSALFPAGEEGNGQGGSTIDPALAEATEAASQKPESGEKRRGGFFRFGRDSDAKRQDDPVLAPLPPAQPVEAPGASAETTAEPEAGETASPNETESPLFELGESEGRASRKRADRRRFALPFLGQRERRETTTRDLEAIADAPQNLAPPPEGGEGGTEPTPAEAASPGPDPSETGSPDSETAPPADVPAFTDSGAETGSAPSRREGGLFSRLPRPGLPSLPSLPSLPKRETDYVSVETVMKDGEFVEEEEEATATAQPDAGTTPAGNNAAPREVDGVKIYSSWDQVEGGGSSTAERILEGIR